MGADGGKIWLPLKTVGKHHPKILEKLQWEKYNQLERLLKPLGMTLYEDNYDHYDPETPTWPKPPLAILGTYHNMGHWEGLHRLRDIIDDDEINEWGDYTFEEIVEDILTRKMIYNDRFPPYYIYYYSEVSSLHKCVYENMPLPEWLLSYTVKRWYDEVCELADIELLNWKETWT